MPGSGPREVLRSIVWFKVHPGMNDEFVAAFLAAGMLERPRAVGGYRGAALHRSLMCDDEYFVLGEWDSEESYAQWQAIASAGAPRDALRRMRACLADHRPNTLVRPVA